MAPTDVDDDSEVSLDSASSPLQICRLESRIWNLECWNVEYGVGRSAWSVVCGL